MCLDVACGTGRSGRLLRDAGYRAVGFDISADQLRFARPRLAAAVRADARRLPVPDASADVATGMYFHTDTEDFAAVVREVARCLRPAAALPTWAFTRVTWGRSCTAWTSSRTSR